MKRITTAERLDYIMKTRELKQVDILKKCEPYCKKYMIKLTKNDLSQYVSGKTEPRSNKLAILCFALNVSEPWLMGYDVPMTFAERLLSAMNQNAITATELAKKSGVSKASISQYLNGIYIASSDSLYQLAKTLNVDITWLMGYEGVIQYEAFAGKHKMICAHCKGEMTLNYNDFQPNGDYANHYTCETCNTTCIESVHYLKC